MVAILLIVAAVSFLRQADGKQLFYLHVPLVIRVYKQETKEFVHVTSQVQEQVLALHAHLPTSVV